MNKTAQFISGLLIFGFITAFVVFYSYKLTADRLLKRDLEITRILDKTFDDKLCEQYALVAVRNAWYPCLKCGGKDSIFLYKGEVWKYGKTCNGEFGGYVNGLPNENLKYFIEFESNETECLIEEKRKIYNYPNLPECLKRDFVLLRPPGNKIDR